MSDEKNQGTGPDLVSATGTGSYDTGSYSSASPAHSSGNVFRRMFDSFKPPADYGFETEGMSRADVALNLMARSKPPLSKRHLMIIAASSCVGTGLFIGSGSSLKTGGPAALLLGFGIMAICLLCTMSSTAELAVRYPSICPFYEYPAKFIDPSLAWAVSAIYFFGWLVTCPLEMIAGAMLTQYWHGDNNPGAKVNPVAWVSLFYVFTVCLNLVGTRAYGEFEFLVGCIKVTATIGFIIFAIIIDCGGGPHHEYIGGANWQHPPDAPPKFTRGFANGFKGVIVVLVSCSFAYGGTEVSGIAAAETANPLKAIPSAVRQVFWRIMVFFIVGTLMIGLLVPVSADIGSSDDGSGSPFVVAIELAGVSGLPSVFNAVIMCSVLGVANAAVYAASRTLTSMAIQGQAPSFLCYIDRRGRPLCSLAVVLVFALLCFVAASNKYSDVFNWLYAFAALAFLYAWSTVCITHIMFRWALKVQGVSKSELLFKTPFGIPGSVVGAGIALGTLGLQFWTYIWPMNRGTMNGNDRAVYYFQNDLSVPFFIVLFVGHKLWFRTRWVRPSEVDLYEGVRQIDYEQLRADQEADRVRYRKNPLRRLANAIC